MIQYSAVVILWVRGQAEAAKVPYLKNVQAAHDGLTNCFGIVIYPTHYARLRGSGKLALSIRHLHKRQKTSGRNQETLKAHFPSAHPSLGMTFTNVFPFGGCTSSVILLSSTPGWIRVSATGFMSYCNANIADIVRIVFMAKKRPGQRLAPPPKARNEPLGVLLFMKRRASKSSTENVINCPNR